MLESKIQSRIIKELEKNGCYVIKIIAANRAGNPDIIACYRGRFLAIEVKQPGESPTDLQKSKLEAIKNAGGEAITLSSSKDIALVLKSL